MRILVVENDASFAVFLATQLQEDHFAVHVAANRVDVPPLLARQFFDLALLDVGDAVAAVELIQQIRLKKPNMPAIVLGEAPLGKGCVRALDAGADDYLAKPLAYSELLARIHAVLRSGHRHAPTCLSIQDLELDRVAHLVHRGNREIQLSRREFALLELLMRNEGVPISRAAILEAVWKFDLNNLTNVVDVYINYLRRKIDTGWERSLIQTIRGVGYQIGGGPAPC